MLSPSPSAPPPNGGLSDDCDSCASDDSEFCCSDADDASALTPGVSAMAASTAALAAAAGPAGRLEVEAVSVAEDMLKRSALV